jgi:hypothetical protein
MMISRGKLKKFREKLALMPTKFLGIDGDGIKIYCNTLSGS